VDSDLESADVEHAIDRGINFVNWAGLSEGEPQSDPFGDALSGLGARRSSVVICAQFAARTAAAAAAELRSLLARLRSDYVDVLTLYYVEEAQEWDTLVGPGGALEYLQAARKDGVVRRIGITSHQRAHAATMATSGLLDVIMIRYNAAHRGAERDVFPVTDARSIPVITYTATRWAALMRPTPDDPPGFVVPGATDWYRFVLQSPSVAVVLAAPHTRAELDEDLTILETAGPLLSSKWEALAAHGERVRRHAGRFA
jgi:predicted aldo/keto reductase-like oxidoreductase